MPSVVVNASYPMIHAVHLPIFIMVVFQTHGQLWNYPGVSVKSSKRWTNRLVHNHNEQQLIRYLDFLYGMTNKITFIDRDDNF